MKIRRWPNTPKGRAAARAYIRRVTKGKKVIRHTIPGMRKFNW